MSKTVKVKLRCDQVSLFAYGEVAGFKHVHAMPPEKGKKTHENILYAKDNPAATFELQIAKGSPQEGFFKPEGEYYLEITEAKVTAKTK